MVPSHLVEKLRSFQCFVSFETDIEMSVAFGSPYLLLFWKQRRLRVHLARCVQVQRIVRRDELFINLAKLMLPRILQPSTHNRQIIPLLLWQ